MIKAIIFDLDMCILDTRSLKGPFFKPVLDVLHAADLPLQTKEKIDKQLWTTSLDDTLDMFSVLDAIAEPIRDAYRRIEVPDGIISFGDEQYIADLKVKKILVTTGYRKFQETKIAKLGIVSLFDEIIIDALDYRDQRKGKKKIFEEIMERYDLNKDELLVVGDNPVSELGVAHSLGISSVQTLRPTVRKWENATHCIKDFSELSRLLEVYT